MTYQLELSVEYTVETRHNSWENLTHKRIFHELTFLCRTNKILPRISSKLQLTSGIVCYLIMVGVVCCRPLS